MAKLDRFYLSSFLCNEIIPMPQIVFYSVNSGDKMKELRHDLVSLPVEINEFPELHR